MLSLLIKYIILEMGDSFLYHKRKILFSICDNILIRTAGPSDKPLISFFSGKKREGKKFLFCFPAVLFVSRIGSNAKEVYRERQCFR
jgi:hypothetical protein